MSGIEMSEIEIRDLTEVDAEAYWEVRLRALREHPEAFGQAYEEQRETPLESVAERFRTSWATPDSFILGARIAGDLVGTVGCVRDRGPKVRHKAIIWGMYVAPEARGRGVGGALLKAAIVRAKAWPGLEQVRLTVVTENAGASRLYRTLGFEVYGLERHALKLGDRYLDEEHMVLWLSGQGRG